MKLIRHPAGYNSLDHTGNKGNLEVKIQPLENK
jgi:hypothetical protein